MTNFASLADLRAACLDLPAGHAGAAAVAAGRDATLTKPPKSLGRLEDIVVWLARWQARNPPRLDRIEVVVFAGNHGVVAQGVSAFPPAVTAQMVANFAAGGAAADSIPVLLPKNSLAQPTFVPSRKAESQLPLTGTRHIISVVGQGQRKIERP